MNWQRSTTWLLLLLAWAGLAFWQLGEYNRLRSSAYSELHREAQTINRALVGGIRTHRGMGRFFEENLQQAIDDVTQSQMVVAAAIYSEDGSQLAAAGNIELLSAGDAACRHASAYPFHDQFEVQSAGNITHAGQGMGGQGRDRGPYWARTSETETEANGISSDDSLFYTTLLLDTTATQTRCRRELLLRGTILGAGFMVLLCVALAWRATLRTAEARGHARLLEEETRHLRDLSQAATGLAHETRNPLSLIRGWTQRLDENCPDGHHHHEKAQAIVEECDRVTARINQFLSFARPANPQLETVNVREVVGELATLMEPIFDAKNLTLQSGDIDATLVIRADREMFRQTLFNLIQNAVQFSPDEGLIKITAGKTVAGAIRIEVSDQGPGVTAEDPNMIFTPYFTTRPDGTGLGLAIVRRIAMAHRWHVGLVPGAEGGATFFLDNIDG